ncbi:hypothetical protein HYY75_09375, partial [bacterium]|nr:hypothetical protein [bacterium]
MAEGIPFINTGALFDISDAYSHGELTDALFDKAMNEALQWHISNCPEFALFLKRKGFKFSGEESFLPEEIPPIFVTIFKEFRLISIPERKIKLELTSSGTTGQRSAIVLDARSLGRILKIVPNIFGSLGLVNQKEKVNYLCFTYDPRVAKNVGTAFSDKVMTGFTQKKSVFYAIQWNSSSASFEFDLDLTVSRLLRLSKQPEAVRILGFPAYLWQVCDELEKRRKRLKLGDSSFVLTGGGWKIHKDREVTKELFKDRVAYVLGIPERNVRDSYGMVEHGIPYVDCEFGKLHVPIYSRARVVDPETLLPCAADEPGLLHLMTPYLSSYPSISLLSTDLAKIESHCQCNRPGKTIALLGRAGLS